MKKVIYAAYLLIYTVIANSYVWLAEQPEWLWLLIPLGLFVNVFAGTVIARIDNKRLKCAYHGAFLLTIFEVSAFLSVIYHIVLAFRTVPHDYWTWIWSAVTCIGVQALLFWNGIITVYLTSVQLGIKQRVIGALCGMLPLINLFVLNVMLETVFKEVAFEAEKERINRARRDEQLCATKYPLLMVHGVFFRDNKYFNYWGRIPKELEQNGARVYYGNHQSAACVADSAGELTDRIQTIVRETGCEKVNIIAHSKGGLDCRYALAHLGAAPYVASLTTVNTPHRGCEFADYLLTKISPKVQKKVADTYNAALKKFGDTSPDFLAAVGDLTASACTVFDRETPMPDTVFCQSVGSVLIKAGHGKFPLNFSYHLVKHFDGINDGLVSEKSFKWSENYTLLTPTNKHGISHADIIDLTRENIRGFDVREFYVQLVNDLKNRGL